MHRTPKDRRCSCLPRLADAKTSAPTRLAYWMAARPTPPAAELIRMRSPACSLACSARAYSTVMNTMGMWAASAKVVTRGMRASAAWGTTARDRSMPSLVVFIPNT